MKTVTSIDVLRAWRSQVRGRLGLVPTMGYLHAGHVSLVERARRENDSVAATLFVNPLQFGPHEDLQRYPRDLERDQALLSAAGCDLLFAPPALEVYRAGFATAVEPGPVALPLEGQRRPGHFRGVATVVTKLLNLTQPARAYFGQKDAQQLAVVRRVVDDLDLPVEIVGCPTVREPDGLALSSRNSYLTAVERAQAPAIYRALRAAHAAWSAGERQAQALCAAMTAVLSEAPDLRVDYAVVADPQTFLDLEVVAGPALLLVAAHLGRARLIDNLALEA